MISVLNNTTVPFLNDSEIIILKSSLELIAKYKINSCSIEAYPVPHPEFNFQQFEGEYYSLCFLKDTLLFNDSLTKRDMKIKESSKNYFILTDKYF